VNRLTRFFHRLRTRSLQANYDDFAEGRRSPTPSTPSPPRGASTAWIHLVPPAVFRRTTSMHMTTGGRANRNGRAPRAVSCLAIIPRLAGEAALPAARREGP